MFNLATKLNYLRMRPVRLLKITRKIVVSVKFHSFCASTIPSCRNILGRAQASAYFPVTDNGQVHLYPQSLVKQLPVDQELLLSDVDIFAEYVN